MPKIVWHIISLSSIEILSSDLSLLNSLEIDFVALKGEDRIYIQVALSALDEQDLQRELAPFDLVKDNYSKYLITMDKLNLSQNGYKHLQTILHRILKPAFW